MKLPTPLARLALGGALLAFAACDGGNPKEPPMPGTLTATLVSPNGGEGAVLLELTGEGVGDVALASGGHVFVEGTSPKRVLLVFDEPGTTRFTVEVPDVGDPPAVRFVEVVAPNNQVRASLSGYKVEFGQ